MSHVSYLLVWNASPNFILFDLRPSKEISNTLQLPNALMTHATVFQLIFSLHGFYKGLENIKENNLKLLALSSLNGRK